MLIRLDTKIGHIDNHVFKKNPSSRSQDFRKNAQIQKLPQNYYANDLRKTIRSRDREHQFQQNFLGVNDTLK